MRNLAPKLTTIIGEFETIYTLNYLINNRL